MQAVDVLRDDAEQPTFALELREGEVRRVRPRVRHHAREARLQAPVETARVLGLEKALVDEILAVRVEPEADLAAIVRDVRFSAGTGAGEHDDPRRPPQ